MSLLRQKPVTSKTATATLTYKELGDVVVDSSGAATITLPTPSPGLWYRVSSVNSGEVSVSDGSSTLATLKQAESALFLANSTSGWWTSKGGGSVTKDAIEAVLTGEITSHTHAYAPEPIVSASAPTTATEGILGQLYIETATPTIYYCSEIDGSDYTWTELSGGSAYELPQANGTTLGGIKAATRDTETQEVKIDAATGKLYTAAPDAAANGIPDGGTAGQIIYKNSATNYDVYWDDPPSGGESESIWGGM